MSGTTATWPQLGHVIFLPKDWAATCRLLPQVQVKSITVELR
jgi:hypothetical protein